jgi:hypothetical protein
LAELTLFQHKGHVVTATRAAVNVGDVLGSEIGPVSVEKGVGRFSVRKYDGEHKKHHPKVTKQGILKQQPT